ncbi:hypothetical protein EV426DRAFT_577824 [Tirmania nivea]|nr:hypothetical protein EV426DRAFT_577824 [Tirmania nivea]
MDDLQLHGKLDELGNHNDNMEENSRHLMVDGKNILVVEDNWAHQVVTEERLIMMRCKAKIAVNGRNMRMECPSGQYVERVACKLNCARCSCAGRIQTTENIRKDPELRKGETDSTTEESITEKVALEESTEENLVMTAGTWRMSLQHALQEDGDGDSKTIKSTTSVASSTESTSARSTGTPQLIPPGGDVSGLTFTGATLIESEKE